MRQASEIDDYEVICIDDTPHISKNVMYRLKLGSSYMVTYDMGDFIRIDENYTPWPRKQFVTVKEHRRQKLIQILN